MWIAAAKRPRWGEIWAFCDAAGLVEVHRCVGRRKGRTRFWGDGNAEADVLVEDALLVGRVVAIQAPGGPYRPATRGAQLARAAAVGARRLPRRLYYRTRAALTRAAGRRHDGGDGTP